SLLNNPDLAEHLKQNAFKKVSRLYNWRSIAERTVELYRDILEDASNNPWMRGSLPAISGM
ncbi:MAG: hypothetical protein QW797_02320, partial [Thermoproteota archaeon]